MTRQEIAAKLREALALMNDNGAHWVKGDFIEVIEYGDDFEGVEYGYCSLGAIRQVTGTSVEDPSEESNAVAFALAEVLPPTPEETRLVGPTAEDLAFERIVVWNDDRLRTWEQVVERFNEAAVRAEQSA